MSMPVLDIEAPALVLHEAPTVASLGRLVIDSGHDFHWVAARPDTPWLVTPSGIIVGLDVRDYAPYLPDTETMAAMVAKGIQTATSAKPPVGGEASSDNSGICGELEGLIKNNDFRPGISSKMSPDGCVSSASVATAVSPTIDTQNTSSAELASYGKAAAAPYVVGKVGFVDVSGHVERNSNSNKADNDATALQQHERHKQANKRTTDAATTGSNDKMVIQQAEAFIRKMLGMAPRIGRYCCDAAAFDDVCSTTVHEATAWRCAAARGDSNECGDGAHDEQARPGCVSRPVTRCDTADGAFSPDRVALMQTSRSIELRARSAEALAEARAQAAKLQEGITKLKMRLERQPQKRKQRLARLTVHADNSSDERDDHKRRSAEIALRRVVDQMRRVGS